MHLSYTYMSYAVQDGIVSYLLALKQSEYDWNVFDSTVLLAITNDVLKGTWEVFYEVVSR